MIRSHVDIDPRTHWTSGRWDEEPFESARRRLPPFGTRFFELLFELVPASEIEFLRWSIQPEDIHAIHARPVGGFGVQVDPSIELLVVWGQGGQSEYGDWCADRAAAALEHVRRLIAGGHRLAGD